MSVIEAPRVAEPEVAEPEVEIPDRDPETELLKTARSVLADSGWCKHDLAQDEDGRSCTPASKRAVSFCVYGALMKGSVLLGEAAPRGGAFDSVVRRLNDAAYIDFVHFNDSIARKKQDVLDLFDRAIEGE
jgi:hypothetical protein